MLIGFALGFQSVVWAQAPVCNFCNTKIEGRYVKWNDNTVACMNCMETLPKCDLCGRLFKQVIKDRTGKYCNECYRKAEHCPICNNVIIGKYYKIENRGIFCDNCKEQLPACMRCGCPVKDGIKTVGEARTVLLCRKCYDSTERCYACGMPLTNKYYSLPLATDRKFCADCKALRNQCDFCASPVGRKSYLYADGRVSCSECYSTAVKDLEIIIKLEKQARAFMLKRLGIKLPPESECPVYLVSARELSRETGKTLDMSKEFNSRERGLFQGQTSEVLKGKKVVKKTKRQTIFIEKGLPQIEAFGTIAHELTHLWQFYNFPNKEVDKRWVEGVACWVQYHALKSLGEEKADRLAALLALNPDPVYGKGLRMVLELEKKHGFKNTLKNVLRKVR